MLNTGALEELLPLCEKEGVGVVPYQLLQGGMLTGKYRRGQEAPAGSRLAEKPEWMKPCLLYTSGSVGWRPLAAAMRRRSSVRVIKPRVLLCVALGIPRRLAFSISE